MATAEATVRVSRVNPLEEFKREQSRQLGIAAELQQTLAAIEAEVGSTYQEITNAPDDLELLEALSRELRTLKLRAAGVEREIQTARDAAARSGQEFQRWTEQVAAWRWRRRQLVEMLASSDDDGQPATDPMLLSTDAVRNRATVIHELQSIFRSLEGFK